MTTHLTIDHGRIVNEPPRHLRLVVSNDWPDENDVDHRDIHDGNPIAAAFWCSLTVGALCLFIGFIAWAAVLR